MIQKATYLAVICLLVADAAPKKLPAFHLEVPGLPEGSFLPVQFTCNGRGGNLSPPLSWSGEPAETQSFALTMDVPSINGPFAQWVLWDIPASVHALAAGAKSVGVPGRNGLGDRLYDGPCPPSQVELRHEPHTYVIHMFAIDVPSLNLKPGKGIDALEQAMRKHVLATAEFHVRYQD